MSWEINLHALYTNLNPVVERAEELINHAHEKLIDLEEHLKTAFDKLEDSRAAFQKILTDVQQLQAAPDSLMIEFQGLLDQVCSNIDDATNKLTDQGTQLADTLSEQSEKAGEFIHERFENFQDLATDYLESLTGNLDDLLGEQKEEIEEVVETVTSLTSSADELVEELFDEAIPDAIKADGNELIQKIEKLNELGIDKIAELTDGIGQIQEKADGVLDLVKQIDPVLETAKMLT